MLTHGGDIYGFTIEKKIEKRDCLDFSANINPLGIPASVREAMIRGLSEAVYYPDPENRELNGALAEHYGLKSDWFLCGNGGADLIYRLVYGERPKKALLPAPTFLEYEEALTQTRTEVTAVPVDEILEHMTADTDLLFLCNPNNPTGLLLEEDFLEAVVEKAERFHIRLVVDECFLDFVEPAKQNSAVRFLQKCPELLILKSFTKMYAIPGIRLGYCMSSDTDLLRRMKKAGQTWPVNAVAKAAGLAALKEEAFVTKTVAYISTERKALQDGLRRAGAVVTKGEANYVFFHMDNRPDLYERLAEKHILIRRCSNYRSLGDCDYRVAVKTHEENDRFLKALMELDEPC